MEWPFHYTPEHMDALGLSACIRVFGLYNKMKNRDVVNVVLTGAEGKCLGDVEGMI